MISPQQRPDTWQHPITRRILFRDSSCTEGGVHTWLAVFFMELRASGQPVRLTALVGLAFILVMFALTFTDVSWPRF